MKRTINLLLVLVLAGCREGPETRRDLALCKMDKRARDGGGAYDTEFVKTCMQSKSYVIDMTKDPNCENLSPELAEQCYRSDTEWDRLAACAEHLHCS